MNAFEVALEGRGVHSGRHQHQLQIGSLIPCMDTLLGHDYEGIHHSSAAGCLKTNTYIYIYLSCSKSQTPKDQKFGARFSTRRSRIRRKSVCKSRSCTSSTMMCVAPSRLGLLCITFSRIPTVQNTTWVVSSILSSKRILCQPRAKHMPRLCS